MKGTEKKGLINICIETHLKINKMIMKYYEELRKHYYTSATTYLDLIQTFKMLLNRRSL